MTNHSKKKAVKVALIEFYPYHSELIFSQLLFLNESDCAVTLICDRKNAANSAMSANYADILTYDFTNFISFYKLWRYLLKADIQYLVFNTAQGNRMLKFVLFPLPKRVVYRGILHNTSKLYASFGQKLIAKKIKSYYVLAHYMQKHFPKIKQISSCHVNCAYIPDFPSTAQKPENEIWIGVPGSIEYKRRDYDFLLDLVRSSLFPKNVKIVLLGNASKYEGPLFLSQIASLGFQSKFIWFESFIPDSIFYSYMKAFNYLLPLIHPTTPSSSLYLKYKVSGTFIQSMIYSTPMLCHKMFDNNDFLYNAIFYNSLEDCLNNIKLRTVGTGCKLLEFENDRNTYYDFLINREIY